MKARKYLFVVMIVLVLSLFAVPVLAMSPAQDTMPPNVLQEIINVGVALATLTGVAALISVIVNVLKYFNRIPDGDAGRVFALANLVAFILLALTRVIAPQYSLEYLDGLAGQVANIAIFITGYLFQLGIGQTAYEVIKKADIPILSHSLSATTTIAVG